MANPRVLKAHREAVRAALPEAQRLLAEGDLEAFIDHLATAVVTCEDHTVTEYCLVIRQEVGRPLVYGPYRTADAATKAWESGCMLPGQGGIFELIPAPLGPKPHTAKQRADGVPSWDTLGAS